jgi:phospholipid transport system substrate-binding protein
MTLFRLASTFAAALVVAVLGVAGVACPARADDTEAAKRLIGEVVAEAKQSFAGQTLARPDRLARLHAMVAKYTDLTILSEDILGRYWTKASAEEKSSFVILLTDCAQESWSSYLNDMSDRLRIDFTTSEPAAGGRIVVHSLVVVPNDTVAVDWTTTQAADGRPVIADVAVEGISRIQTMKGDFLSFLRANGGRVQALLDALRQKVAGFQTGG